jgi:arsenical pump membrane protein
MIWAIAVAATIGVIVQPFGIPQYVFALLGAGLLVATGLLSWHAALRGMANGTDVYLFLTGMMLLAELARQEGVFDFVAARAARAARGSGARLFTLVFMVGIVVTAFLSNDATAVVLTPAVAAAARAVAMETPAPLLLACAFTANAASFVLPISNPANLVIYGDHVPGLLDWVPMFALPSALAIGVTYLVLRLVERRTLAQGLRSDPDPARLSAGGAIAASGIGAAALVLMGVSASGLRLGLPTLLCGVGTLCLVRLRSGGSWWRRLRQVSWDVLPLVAGLFVLVQGLDETALVATLAHWTAALAARSAAAAAWTVGGMIGVACNLVNNLPAGLLAGQVLRGAAVPQSVRAAALVGVDLGPNLSVTGSLATILWLHALRREGIAMSGAWFLRVGVLVMPPALVLALLALFPYR